MQRNTLFYSLLICCLPAIAVQALSAQVPRVEVITEELLNCPYGYEKATLQIRLCENTMASPIPQRLSIEWRGRSTYLLAMIHYKGQHFPLDYTETYEILKKMRRSRTGPTVDNYLGIYRENGLAGEKNLLQALVHYQWAAGGGITEAGMVAAHFLVRGEEIEKGFSSMAEDYAQAVEIEYEVAYYRLALLYQVGTGVEKNGAKAYELLKQPAEKCYQPAIDFLSANKR